MSMRAYAIERHKAKEFGLPSCIAHTGRVADHLGLRGGHPLHSTTAVPGSRSSSISFQRLRPSAAARQPRSCNLSNASITSSGEKGQRLRRIRSSGGKGPNAKWPVRIENFVQTHLVLAEKRIRRCESRKASHRYRRWQGRLRVVATRAGSVETAASCSCARAVASNAPQRN